MERYFKYFKRDHLVFLLVFLAGFFTSSIVAYISKNLSVQNSPYYIEIVDDLIEIKASITAGVTDGEIRNYTKELSALVTKYTVHEDPPKSELLLLKNILTSLSGISDVWKVKITYPCNSDNPNKECINKYATDLYRLSAFGKDLASARQIINDAFAQEEQWRKLEDHQQYLISLRMTLLNISISNFFSYHDINI